MFQRSQVSGVALCMSKVKVRDSVSESVSEWQGHLLRFRSKFIQGVFVQNSNRAIFFKVHTGWFFSKSLQGDFLKISTGWFFQNSYRVIFWVRSCLLITLIKCLKGHKSLGSLGSVVKGSIVSLVGPRYQGTRSPIELFWTAKKIRSILSNAITKTPFSSCPGRKTCFMFGWITYPSHCAH